tara:strand:- start:1651 stop:1926 length:276 start_codon:yes stop_codon:yes gene_type:complete
MKSIKARFKKEQELDNGASDYINLFKAVVHQKFTRRTISEWFNKLVDKDDYEPKERNALIIQLYEASNQSEEYVYEPEIESDKEYGEQSIT